MRRSRAVAGTSLVELVFSALILGGATVIFMDLVELASRRVYQANLEHLANQFNSNVLERYRSVRPGDLSRVFRTGADSIRTLEHDPIVQAGLGVAPGASGFGPLSPALVYRTVPGQQGLGRLEIQSSYTSGNQHRTASLESLVHGRKLPRLPSLSEELASRPSAADREAVGLVRALEVSPREPRSQILLPVIRLETRHGTLPAGFAKLGLGASNEFEVVEDLLRYYADTGLPDGSYRVDWVTIGPLLRFGSAGAARTTITLFKVVDGPFQGRVVVLKEVEEGALARTALLGEECTDHGEIRMATGHGPSGVVPASAPLTARVRTSERRAFALAPRLSATGRPQTTVQELTVATFDDDGTSAASPGAARARAVRALAVAGLRAAPSTRS